MIILTGGAGFIGSCLARALNQLGYQDLLIVDHLGSGEKWKNLRHRRYANYLDREEFMNQLSAGKYNDSPIEAVFHFGACSNTLESDASFLMENNYGYSRKLAEFSLQRGIRFIYASSAATYGNGEF